MKTATEITEKQRRALEAMEGARNEGSSLKDYARAHGLVIRELYDAIAGLRRKGLLAQGAKRKRRRKLTWYIQPEEIQRDLDRFIRHYNVERTHQGYRLKGRTPAQALMEALGITEIPDIIPSEEIIEPLPMAA